MTAISRDYKGDVLNDERRAALTACEERVNNGASLFDKEWPEWPTYAHLFVVSDAFGGCPLSQWMLAETGHAAGWSDAKEFFTDRVGRTLTQRSTGDDMLELGFEVDYELEYSYADMQHFWDEAAKERLPC